MMDTELKRTRMDQLRRLGEGLPKVPPNKFDMKFWGTGTLHVEEEEFRCNFAGCAIGWFPKLVKEQTLVQPSGFGVMIGEGNNMHAGFCDIAAYFDITIDEATFLFYAGSYGSYSGPSPTTERVGRRIREFVASKEAR